MRLTPLLRFVHSGGRQLCPYKILGVAVTATEEEVKKAYKERAKETHPDLDQGAAPTRFHELQEAYRLLMDPQLRREHDVRAGHRQSEHAQKAKRMHEYTTRAAGPQQGPGPANAAEAPGWEGLGFGLVLLAGLFLTSPYMRSAPTEEPIQYPRRKPMARKSEESQAELASRRTEAPLLLGESTATVANVAAIVTAPQEELVASEDDAAQAADELVRAFWDPFSNTWQRIPPGYEAPAAMDLTAFHRKRIDTVEWQRMWADGTLSKTIPRGSVEIRYRPLWETHEPILVTDSMTGKTVSIIGRRSKGTDACDVQF